VADWHGGRPQGQNHKAIQGNSSTFRHPPGLKPKSCRHFNRFPSQPLVIASLSSIQNLKFNIQNYANLPLKHAIQRQFFAAQLSAILFARIFFQDEHYGR
jgi:hypothetical protein